MTSQICAANMWKWRLLMVIVATLIVNIKARMPKCKGPPPGFPANPAPPDDRFYLTVANNIRYYVPGETYNVTLHSVYNEARPNKFTGFHIYVESSGDEEEGVPSAGPGTILRIPGDISTKFSERCPAIKESNTLPKTEVTVLWRAPLRGSGCVFIHSQVTEYYNVWYDAVGLLSRQMCEDEREYLDLQEGYRLDTCGACDEAKYEIVFKGSWSQNTHPRDYPEMNWLIQFSDLIGASHTSDYRFWDHGMQASEGLKQFAEYGFTKTLEEEIQSEFGNVRTLIKGKGHKFPDLDEPTYTIARVDSKHHLISVVMGISPSPDWFVGVAGLELCLKNKSWIERRELFLYPWDAGTDSGISYMSSDQQTVPQEAIRRLGSNAPHDERSPFFGSKMQPFGTLYVNRVKVFPKQCEEEVEEGENEDGNAEPDEEATEEETEPGENEEKSEPSNPEPQSCENCSVAPPTEETNDNCVLTEWGSWTPCSPSCGIGMKYQRRQYKLKAKSRGKYFRKDDEEGAKECYGSATTLNYEECNNPECEDFIMLPVKASFINYNVKLVVIHRRRISADKKGSKIHNERYTSNKEGFLTGKDIPSKFSYKKRSYNLQPLQPMSLLQEPQGVNSTPQRITCAVSPWSEWSPCSRTCGIGVKEKRRHLIHGSGDVDSCPQKLIKFKTCRLDPCP